MTQAKLMEKTSFLEVQTWRTELNDKSLYTQLTMIALHEMMRSGQCRLSMVCSYSVKKEVYLRMSIWKK